MALDAEARRAVGVRPLSSTDIEGSRGADGRGVVLPETSATNPGPTDNLRGIEPNTSIDWAGNTTEPEIYQTFGSEVPRGEVFNAPQDQLGDVDGDAPDGWQTRAYERFKNEYPEPLLLFYINHLGWELGSAQQAYLPAA